MCSAPRLQLREQMADVRLDGLLREKELLADLPVDEPVRDELEDLELTRRRLLLDRGHGRRGERDNRPGTGAAPTCGSRLEAAPVVLVTVEDLLALCGVHNSGIGVKTKPL